LGIRTGGHYVTSCSSASASAISVTRPTGCPAGRMRGVSAHLAQTRASAGSRPQNFASRSYQTTVTTDSRYDRVPVEGRVSSPPAVARVVAEQARPYSGHTHGTIRMAIA
jgi:hypothetical protein